MEIIREFTTDLDRLPSRQVQLDDSSVFVHAGYLDINRAVIYNFEHSKHTEQWTIGIVLIRIT